MSRNNFFSVLKKEVDRIDQAKTSKRFEKIITGFTKEKSPKAIIGKEKYQVFNSNDYLGLRHNPLLKKAERQVSEIFGTGPGAVRFISGSLKIHRDLEKALAKFHKRDDAMVFSSSFAANLAVLYCLIAGQNKDSLVDNNVIVISDALNHRSIIDGIRVANLPKEQRTIFRHMDPAHLEEVLENNKKNYKRALVVTDGIFSMLGEYQKLKEIRAVVDKYAKEYENGVLLVVDDAHGVGIAGKTGRGVEEIEDVKADVLIGTFGKAFGADGGYVVANQTIIDYLRESAATYIYSNSVPPGTAGAALKAIELLDKSVGKKLLENSREKVIYFKKQMKTAGYLFAVDSSHPIQPVLIGDPIKTSDLVKKLFKKNIIVTNISFPVVPKGRDEIRVQISAVHTKGDIDQLVKAFAEEKNINSL
ncbi:7-keto-8-aminopelargonate synthetase [Candidatus Roizmanbacteria bacterium CG_4_9_14_3_um_filter_33_18]|uniref:7-keto-8-aminopelargonate synthetase n=3 Tax=Candidatus Roizmaniibacteriota TaxID=1752723 RepID=A0A2M7U9K0_9BACT|nr:MAG: 7-keto-8-aminopelargonate synthetase [Candidatus Roizmanbacteria bacterium CG22_combo_CG10-13_8_21_14_all_34_12]PIZ67914.1 MAG: 7-keto-8-aminopelargonate synthetase [Candidatus Roizmanbacteria bacterium CG_4_10_14_0_2_um_filter_33_96]PJA55624.1 MAG: 7-keto-8-aminopelargonate synthetase [Candidatus Roizmanbacteria bacterium CG_4_9_14_3_um_filter_33_18]